jgi:hypothetical protein
LPGNILYPEFIERCSNIFETVKYFNGNTLICEADLINRDGEKYYQQSIYTDNYIIKGGADEIQFLTTGIGHRIQTFYRGFSISTTFPLHAAIQGIDFNDWFNKFWRKGKGGDCIYIKDKLACLEEMNADNLISDLMDRLVLLKRSFYGKETDEKNIVDKNSISNNSIELAYKCLSILALKYAIKELRKENLILANDCVLFAEMVYLDIVEDSMYIDINNVIQGKANIERLFKYEKQENSINPPIGCFVF